MDLVRLTLRYTLLLLIFGNICSCSYLVPETTDLTTLATASALPERCTDPSIPHDSPAIHALAYHLFKHPVTASCGYLDKPYDNVGLEVHAGIDFEQPLGTPIYAVTTGQVEHVSSLTGQIAVRLADTRLINYFHLNSVAVNANTQVTRGQFLGTVGMRGAANKPHLHLEVRLHYPGKAGLAGISCGGYCRATEIMPMTQNPIVLLNVP